MRLQKENIVIFCRGAIFWCSLAEKNWQFCITVTKKMHPSGEKLQISENPELLMKVQQLLQLISGVDRCYGVVWVTINALPGCCDGIVHWMIHTVLCLPTYTLCLSQSSHGTPYIGGVQLTTYGKLFYYSPQCGDSITGHQ